MTGIELNFVPLRHTKLLNCNAEKLQILQGYLINCTFEQNYIKELKFIDSVVVDSKFNGRNDTSLSFSRSILKNCVIEENSYKNFLLEKTESIEFKTD